MKLLPFAILAALGVFGCAQSGRNAMAPTTGPLATSRPLAPPEAFLTLDQIQPKPVLTNLIKPATSPATRPSLDALELYARARGAMFDDHPGNAVNLLQRAIGADPNSFELRYALGRVYASMSNKSDEAIKAFTAAAQVDPDHLELQVELGREYLAHQDAVSAMRHLRLALQTH